MRWSSPLFVLVGPIASSKAADEAALVKAKELMEVTGVAAIVDQMLQPTMQQIYGLLVAVNPQQGPVIQALLEEHMLPEFRRRVPEFLDLSAQVYAKHFTAAELEEILAFYRTPIGKKTIEKLPIITQQSAQIGQIWGVKLAQDVLRNLAPLLQEKGLKAPNI